MTENGKTSEAQDTRREGGQASPPENYLVTEYLHRMPAVFSRGLLYIVAALVATGIVYIVVGKVDVVIACRSVARVPAGEAAAGSDRELALSTRIRDIEQTLPLRTELFSNRIVSAHNDLNTLAAATSNRLDATRLGMAQKRAAGKTLEADATYWSLERESATAEFASTDELFRKKLTAISEFNAVKSRLDRANLEIEKNDLQKNILSQEVAALERDLENIRTESAAKRETLKNEIRNLGLERTAALDALRSELTQSRKQLELKNGATDERSSDRQAGASNPAGLYMQIVVPNRDAGFVEKGLKIKYKFDAYPYAEYGSLNGRVASMATAAVEDTTQGYVYQAIGSLDQAGFDIKGKHYEIRQGMTATAELVTERKSIFSILLSALKK